MSGAGDGGAPVRRAGPGGPALQRAAGNRVPAASSAQLRLWFAVYLLWIGALVGLALLMFARYEGGDGSAAGLWLLALAAFYLSLCNTLMPLPTAWIVMLAACEQLGLFESAALRVLLIAVVGATATMMANLNEYHVLGYVFRARLGERVRQTRAYRWAVRWFDVAPFQTLALVAFVPIPIDVVRFLAILRGYPRRRFAAAYWLGRCLRYALLAGLSAGLRLGPWDIALIQVALILALAARLVLRFRREPAGTPLDGVDTPRTQAVD